MAPAAFEFGELRGDQAEQHRLAQRFAPAVCSRKKAVHFAVCKERFGNRLVAAGAEPDRTEVAAADVHRHGHVGGLGRENAVQAGSAALGERVGVDSAGSASPALFPRAEFASARAVKLQVAAVARISSEHRILPVCAMSAYKTSLLSR